MLTVTTTPVRLEKMLAALRSMTDGRGSNMFLFADQMSLAASNPPEVTWPTLQTPALPNTQANRVASMRSHRKWNS